LDVQGDLTAKSQSERNEKKAKLCADQGIKIADSKYTGTMKHATNDTITSTIATALSPMTILHLIIQRFVGGDINEYRIARTDDFANTFNYLNEDYSLCDRSRRAGQRDMGASWIRTARQEQNICA
jgi:hypothetical protein